MSRIGKKPVQLPKNVTATIDGRKLTCRGPMVERQQRPYAERVDRAAGEQQRP